jgi:hypothetical protein
MVPQSRGPAAHGRRLGSIVHGFDNHVVLAFGAELMRKDQNSLPGPYGISGIVSVLIVHIGIVHGSHGYGIGNIIRKNRVGPQWFYGNNSAPVSGNYLGENIIISQINFQNKLLKYYG